MKPQKCTCVTGTSQMEVVQVQKKKKKRKQGKKQNEMGSIGCYEEMGNFRSKI